MHFFSNCKTPEPDSKLKLSQTSDQESDIYRSPSSSILKKEIKSSSHW